MREREREGGRERDSGGERGRRRERGKRERRRMGEGVSNHTLMRDL